METCGFLTLVRDLRVHPVGAWMAWLVWHSLLVGDDFALRAFYSSDRSRDGRRVLGLDRPFEEWGL